MEAIINMLPFYAETLAVCYKIHKDIDKMYARNKEEYYNAAINSEYYDSFLGKEKSLVVEEYYKKCLGIILLGDDEDGITNLFKKGYNKTYRYYKSASSYDLIRYSYDMKSYLDKLSDDLFCGNEYAFLFFCNGKCENTDELIATTWERIVKSTNDECRFRIENAAPEIAQEVDRLYNALPSNILDNVLTSSTRGVQSYKFIYAEEELNELSLFDELEFSSGDVKNVVFSYVAGKIFWKDKLDFEQYVIAGLHLKAMCKAYKHVKDTYFKNNKETMYVELGSIKKELFKAKSDLTLLENKFSILEKSKSEQSDELVSQNEKLRKEIDSLKEQLKEAQANSKELASLREYFFNQEKVDVVDERVEINTEKLNSVHGIIIGGHPNWQNKIKQILPDWKIIGENVNVLDESIIKNCDIVIFNTGHMSHKLYKVMNTVRMVDAKVGYISSTNAEESTKEIFRLCEEL